MDPKSIFQSKTFWGAVISIVSMFSPTLLTKIFGTPDQAKVLQDVMLVMGFIVTVYGRFTASQPVTLTGTPPAPSSSARIAQLEADVAKLKAQAPKN